LNHLRQTSLSRVIRHESVIALTDEYVSGDVCRYTGTGTVDAITYSEIDQELRVSVESRTKRPAGPARPGVVSCIMSATCTRMKEHQRTAAE